MTRLPEVDTRHQFAAANRRRRSVDDEEVLMLWFKVANGFFVACGASLIRFCVAAGAVIQ
jgi:hypothetical protein